MCVVANIFRARFLLLLPKHPARLFSLDRDQLKKHGHQIRDFLTVAVCWTSHGVALTYPFNSWLEPGYSRGVKVRVALGSYVDRCQWRIRDLKEGPLRAPRDITRNGLGLKFTKKAVFMD